MLIKDWEFNKFIDNVLKFKAILIHGPDRGKVNERSDEIYKKVFYFYDKSVEIVKLNYEEFSRSNSYINELIYQKSFFYKFSVIKINLDLIKADKDFISIFENIDKEKANLIILESEYLPNNSEIVNKFRNSENLALITCYQEVNVKNSILKYAKEFSLFLDEPSLNYLSNRFGNDSMITKSEIKKLALFADGKKISFEDILNAVGDNSVINIYNLCDSIGIASSNEISYLYDKTCSLGVNYITILRSIRKHFNILLLAKEKKLHDIKNLKPIVHFSRHGKINKQLSKLKIKSLRDYSVNILDLEISCKLNNSINDILIKKSLFDIIDY
ncbi:MAG: hypothetical protein CMP36_01045 [Rickettsiales bacterium]|nr:hypothetical protein [Rickettsiales bacterium]OUV82633.1 MAG: hypothetical protein CBC91_01425 [Rickettsiales bacterium TMED131]|tara:strand:- start:1572 stop:2558 length:987 start_codon:yes stop_codon:yes gene_type:complete